MSQPPATTSSTEALDQVVERRDALVAYAFGILHDWASAEDVFQEACIIVDRDWDPQTIRTSPFLWAKGVVRIQALQLRRRKEKEPRLLGERLEDLFHREIEELDWENRIHERLRRRVAALRACFANLRPDSQRLIYDFYFCGRSGAEIASDRNQSPAYQRQHLHRVRRQLRDCMATRLKEAADRPDESGSEHFIDDYLCGLVDPSQEEGAVVEAWFENDPTASKTLCSSLLDAAALATVSREVVRPALPPQPVFPPQYVPPSPPAQSARPLPASRWFWRAAATLVAGSALWFVRDVARYRHVDLVSVGGGVTIFRDGGAFPGSVGDRLVVGDRVEVSDGGIAQLRFGIDDTSVDLAAGSEFSIRVGQGAVGWRERRVLLSAGALVAEIDKQSWPRRTIFESPGAVAEVLGTTLELNVAGGETRLSVAEGRVRFKSRNGQRETVVTGGEAALISQSESGEATVVVPGKYGGLRKEVWLDIPGNKVGDLRATPRYPDSPDEVGVVHVFEASIDGRRREFYGQRLTGYLHPPVTGEYRFYIAADDLGELRLSSDASPANLREIASLKTIGINPREYTRFPEQVSEAITLVAGRRYFVEALHSQGGGEDQLSVAWEGPGIERAPIDGIYLSQPE